MNMSSAQSIWGYSSLGSLADHVIDHYIYLEAGIVSERTSEDVKSMIKILDETTTEMYFPIKLFTSPTKDNYNLFKKIYSEYPHNLEGKNLQEFLAILSLRMKNLSVNSSKDEIRTVHTEIEFIARRTLSLAYEASGTGH